MTKPELELLSQELIRDEGVNLHPYPDTEGNTTLGIGRNITANGISHDEAEFMLMNDISTAEVGLKKALPWVEKLDPVRQRVLLNVAFNCGVRSLLTFKKMLEALEQRDYDVAADELLNSKAGKMLAARYSRLAFMLRFGKTSTNV